MVEVDGVRQCGLGRGFQAPEINSKGVSLGLPQAVDRPHQVTAPWLSPMSNCEPEGRGGDWGTWGLGDGETGRILFMQTLP